MRTFKPGSRLEGCPGHIESLDGLAASRLAQRQKRLGLRGLLALRRAVAAATAVPLLSDEEVRLYDRLCVMAAVPDAERVTCPVRGCGAINIVDPSVAPRGSAAAVECASCGSSFCRTCSSRHPGLTCQEAAELQRQQQARQALEERASAAAVAATSKPCPWCGTAITHYKHHGCHHIKPGGGCPGCHNHFCYLCGEPSRQRGKWDRPCDCPTFCQVGCSCPTCPDCRPGKPCPLCDDAERCPACNPQAAVRGARVTAAAAAAAAEVAATAAAEAALLVASRVAESALEGLKAAAATMLLGLVGVLLAMVLVQLFPSSTSLL